MARIARRNTLPRAEAPVSEDLRMPDEQTTSDTAFDIEVSAGDIVSDAPKSPISRLGERLKSVLLGGGEANEEPAKTRVTKGKADEIAGQMMLIGAILLSWVSESFFDRFAPDYQPVAPTTQEAQAITLPIARILSRRIKASGKVSEDTLDYFFLLSAIGIYADRARDTAREISNAIKEQKRNAIDSTSPSPFATETTYPFDAQSRVVYPQQQPAPTSVATRSGRANVVQGREIASQPARGNIDPMAELLRADAEGRSRLGLN